MSEPKAQAVSALLLALAAGIVDAVSFIVLHHTFTANMTGNTTKLGIAAGKGDSTAVLPLGVAVLVFVVAIFLATAPQRAGACARRPHRCCCSRQRSSPR